MWLFYMSDSGQVSVHNQTEQNRITQLLAKVEELENENRKPLLVLTLTVFIIAGERILCRSAFHDRFGDIR